MSEAISKVYAVIRPALTLLGLKFSSVATKQAKLDLIYKHMIYVSQMIEKRRYIECFNSLKNEETIINFFKR